MPTELTAFRQWLYGYAGVESLMEIWMATESRQTAQIDQAAIDRTVAGLKSRNVDAVVAENGRRSPRQMLIDMIPDGAEVFKSTSETLDTIGYSDYIRETDRYRNLYLEISAKPDRDRQRELRRLASVAEYLRWQRPCHRGNGRGHRGQRLRQPAGGLCLRGEDRNLGRRCSEDLPQLWTMPWLG